MLGLYLEVEVLLFSPENCRIVLRFQRRLFCLIFSNDTRRIRISFATAAAWELDGTVLFLFLSYPHD